MITTIHWKIAGIIAVIAIISSVPLYLVRVANSPPPTTSRSMEAIEFAGSEKCAECHKPEYDRWKGSHHDLAMDVATQATVLGDFNQAVFRHFGQTSLFFRQGDKFMVRTQGPGGKIGDFEVSHVFGVYPLQQYLVPFPDGKYQCLPLAWDIREKRWYHLYPDEPLDPEDWLYWTNRGQNWNGMCAECHSTNLQKNYDPETDQYRTTWSEIDVGCEACHGPGGRHVAWAQLPAMARPQVMNDALTVRTREISARDQVHLCAPCHSRRTILGDYSHHEKDLLDSLLPVLLTEGLYFADGQILDEVYVYGSFTQSKMYSREVRCGDCHDVHSLKLVQQGNALCLQCHRAGDYETPAHHFHKGAGEPGDAIKDKDGAVMFEVGSGAQCVQCHMPGRTYMGVDYRPDHSLRIPRPDLSLQIEVPNACTRCHWDKSLEWADQTMTKWFGPGRTRHYGTVLAAGRLGLPEAEADLNRLALDPLYPVIVRATALVLLGQYPGEKTRGTVAAAMTDPESLVRRTAVSQARVLSPEARQKLLAAMLHDPIAAVRMEAAFQMSAIPGLNLDPETEQKFRAALTEYQDSMRYSADFAFARFNLGVLNGQLGDLEEAEKQYRAAIKVDDQFFMAKVNLAMIRNRQGDNGEAETLLRQALEVRNDLYEVHFSLGLLLAEEKKYREAVKHLDLATQGLPDFARAFYNLGRLLDFLKETERAQTALERAFDLEPDNPDFLKALFQHYLGRQDFEKIREMAEKMMARDPASRLARELMLFVEQQSHERNVPESEGSGFDP